jgi:hypothetical protein
VRRDRLLRAAAPFAGPVLIVAGVLVVDHAFAFGGKLTNQHEDVLGLTLPTYCFLGKSLAAGHLPLWNPFSLAGLPFAADPQSGWAYLPAMLLFSTLGCAAAMRWYVVLQPVLAGLGLYWFLRSERLSRPAATTGGAALGLVMAASYIGISIAFAAAIGWSALMLAAASRYMRAERWPGRLAWLAATAAAGGQLTAAYATDGLALGAGALAAYLAARVVGDLRAKRSPGLVAALVGLLVVAAPLVNLAYLLPRIGYVRGSTVGLGYAHLQHLQSRLNGVAFPAYNAPGSRPEWPLGLTRSPGSYLAVAALVLTGAALWSRRRRGLAIGFSTLGLVSYVLSLDAFARWAREHARHWPGMDFYLHDPRRFRYGLVLAAAVLAGLGLQALVEARSWRWRVAMLAPGAGAWVALPLLFHVPGHSGAWVFGLVAGAAALAATSWRPALALAVPVVVAVEMAASGLAGQSVPYLRVGLGIPTQPPGAFAPLRGPEVDAARYATPDRIARAMLAAGGGRYVTFVPEVVRGRDGYLPLQTLRYRGLEVNGRGMMFRLQDVQGYNSVAPVPYWAWVRTVDAHPTRYNLTFFTKLPAQVLDLLDVRFVIGDRGISPAPDLRPVVREGAFTLYRVTPAAMAPPGGHPRPPERATFVPVWSVVPTAQTARERTAAASFDPRSRVFLQEDPGISPSGRAGTGRVGSVAATAQSIRVAVRETAAGVVLVRIPWDRHWHATVDGRPAPDLKADGFLQAVPVPAGTHTVRIEYRDGSVAAGVAGSALALAALLGPAAWLAGRSRRRAPAGETAQSGRVSPEPATRETTAAEPSPTGPAAPP